MSDVSKQVDEAIERMQDEAERELRHLGFDADHDLRHLAGCVCARCLASLCVDSCRAELTRLIQERNESDQAAVNASCRRDEALAWADRLADEIYNPGVEVKSALAEYRAWREQHS